MKKTLLALAVSAIALVSGHSQSIDYGMTAAVIKYPTAATTMANGAGGFKLLGVTPGSSFNPAGATLAQLLNSSNMLDVNGSFTSIQEAGAFYVSGLACTFSTSATIATGTKLYVLGSGSTTFASDAPWALVTGTDSGWSSPNPTDPFGSSIIELSLGGNSIVASSGATTAYFGTAASQSQTSSGDQNLNLVVPEPSTYALLGMSALALGSYVVRRRRRA